MAEHDGHLVRFHPRFLAFAREYNFVPRACNPASGWEKGKVERGGIGYVRQNFWPLAPAFARYVDLKRALGRRFDLPARTLQSLDRFLCDQSAKYSDLNASAFQAWCHTHEHVTSGVRRVRMLEVRSFCLYRRRTEPQCFVPDSSFFPPYHQRLKPYIFSATEVGKLLSAAARLKRNPASPVRPELTRLAIVLLFTTGMRRGELLKLTLGDYDRQEATLNIRETKFYKSRLLPINGEIVDEIERYLRVRVRRRLPVSADTPLMWNATRGAGPTPVLGCDTVCSLSSNIAASPQPQGSCRESRTYGTASLSMPCCAGTEPAPMWRLT